MTPPDDNLRGLCSYSPPSFTSRRPFAALNWGARHCNSLSGRPLKSALRLFPYAFFPLYLMDIFRYCFRTTLGDDHVGTLSPRPVLINFISNSPVFDMFAGSTGSTAGRSRAKAAASSGVIGRPYTVHHRCS